MFKNDVIPVHNRIENLSNKFSTIIHPGNDTKTMKINPVFTEI